MAATRSTAPTVISAIPACEREFDEMLEAVIMGVTMEVIVVIADAVTVAAACRVGAGEIPSFSSQHVVLRSPQHQVPSLHSIIGEFPDAIPPV